MGTNDGNVKVLKCAKDNTEKETVNVMTYPIVWLVCKDTLYNYKQHKCGMGKICQFIV